MIAERPDLVAQFVAARRHLRAFLLTMTRRMDIADEILQELSVQILREARRGTVPENPYAWMLGMARHRVADYYRSQARQQHNLQRLLELAETMEAAFIENPPPPSEACEEDDPRLQHLRSCMEQLTEKTRSMLEDRYRQSKPIEAIANKMNWTMGSVKVALSKARKVLAECVRRKLAEKAGVPHE